MPQPTIPLRQSEFAGRALASRPAPLRVSQIHFTEAQLNDPTFGTTGYVVAPATSDVIHVGLYSSWNERRVAAWTLGTPSFQALYSSDLTLDDNLTTGMQAAANTNIYSQRFRFRVASGSQEVQNKKYGGDSIVCRRSVNALPGAGGSSYPGGVGLPIYTYVYFDVPVVP